jgi:hypothetical protein
MPPCSSGALGDWGTPIGEPLSNPLNCGIKDKEPPSALTGELKMTTKRQKSVAVRSKQDRALHEAAILPELMRRLPKKSQDIVMDYLAGCFAEDEELAKAFGLKQKAKTIATKRKAG